MILSSIFIFLLFILLILLSINIAICFMQKNIGLHGGGNNIKFPHPILYYSYVDKNIYKLENTLHNYGFQYRSPNDKSHIIFNNTNITQSLIVKIYTKIELKQYCFVFESGIIRCFSPISKANSKLLYTLQKIFSGAKANNILYACSNNTIVMNNILLPSLGLTRRPKSLMNAVVDGTLLPFYKILTNYLLIPYTDATANEITAANNIYVNSAFFSLQNLMDVCYSYNVFLISHSAGKIIGYLTFNKEHYIYITIIEEYQHRGIATAMIAQFMEIYYFRIYPLPNYYEINSIYMELPYSSFNITNKIANRLFFTFNGKNYERPCKIKDVIFNGDKVLTYKIFSINNGTNENILIKNLEPYMKQSELNFIHLAMTSFDTKKSRVLKASTGSYLSKTFMVQSAELKSSINSKVSEIEKNINKEHFQKNIAADIVVFFGLYLSNNGVKKLYVMDYYRKKKDTKICDIKLKKFIEIISNLLIVGKYYIYNESNAGFNTFSIAMSPSIDDPTEPKITIINTHIEGSRYKYMTDSEYIMYMNQFSLEYYNWLSKCIILPHFGVSKQIKPIAIDIAQNTLDVFTLIPEIIANLSLDNITKIEKIDIYYEESNIGYINLHNKNDIMTLKHIELHTTHRKKNIASHVLFILMEIIAAYYSPKQIFIQFLVVDNMIQIANNLKFEKKKDYFIRKCRRPDDHIFISKIEDNTIGIHAFADIDWVAGTKNFDCGSGNNYKFINDYLLYRFHIKNIPYDPYAIPKHINDHALKMIAAGNFDTATSMSVINVIPDKADRAKHINLIHSSLKKNGIAYFKIYQGDKSGIINATKYHQNNLELEYYIGEIKDIFAKVEVVHSKNLIIAYK